MLQQGGYGQIYGSMGGAGVGVEIYNSQRRSVNFARFVELAQLNMRRRQLQQSEAQMQAELDDRKQSRAMQAAHFELESRRLDMQDKQNQWEKERAVKAYELQETQRQFETDRRRSELVAAQQKYEQELQQRQNELAFKQSEAARKQQQEDEDRQWDRRKQANDETMRLAASGAEPFVNDKDGNVTPLPAYPLQSLSGMGAAVPVRQPEDVSAHGETRLRFDDSQKAQLTAIDDDIKRDEALAATSEKNTVALEHELQALQDSLRYKPNDGQLKKDIGAKTKEIEEARKKSKLDAAYEFKRAYAFRAKQEPGLLSEIPYQKWAAMPFAGYDFDAKDGAKSKFVVDLLNSDYPQDRKMLRSIVEMGGVFNYDAAQVYQRATALDLPVTQQIPVRVWLEVPWDDMSADIKSQINILASSKKPEDIELLKRFVTGKTEYSFK